MPPAFPERTAHGVCLLLRRAEYEVVMPSVSQILHHPLFPRFVTMAVVMMRRTIALATIRQSGTGWNG